MYRQEPASSPLTPQFRVDPALRGEIFIEVRRFDFGPRAGQVIQVVVKLGGPLIRSSQGVFENLDHGPVHARALLLRPALNAAAEIRRYVS